MDWLIQTGIQFWQAVGLWEVLKQFILKILGLVVVGIGIWYFTSRGK